MLKSMTGYGKFQVRFNGKTIVSEIRTLNSKQSDISLRLPAPYREKELEIRAMLSEYLKRGKIELTITLESGDTLSGFSINKALAKSYYREFQELANEMNDVSMENFFEVLVRLPEVIQPDPDPISDEEWKAVKDAVLKTILTVDNYRTEEAKQMQEEFRHRIDLILNKLDGIEPFEKNRIEKIRTKLIKGYHELNQGLDHDDNRFEQEILFYIEKLDIAEEKQRLRKNCELFKETMSQQDSQGKKLNFISQEIGREINTLGSKSNDADIQRHVVEMKDELEKIREQLFNIL